MADNTSKYVIEFQAELRKLKQGFAEVKRQQKINQQDAKKNSQQQKQFEKERTKWQGDYRKQQEKDRKAERIHLSSMSREETKRHKQNLNLIKKSHDENAKLLKKNQELEKKLSRGGGGEDQKRPGFLRRTLGGVGTALGGGAMLGAGFLIGAARSGYEKYIEYGQALSRSIGLGRGRDVRRGIGGAMGGRLGFSMTDTASMVPMMARATGELGPRELQQAVRATGMEGGEAADIFGTIRRSGVGFGGAGRGRQSAGGREFQRMISSGMASGLEKARLPEYFQGVQRIAEEQRNISTGIVDIGGIAKQLTMLGRTGLPGMQGAAGAGVLQKFQTALLTPGGGEWGEAFVRQAMGFGKPGGTTSFYGAERMRERGIQDPQNVIRIMTELRKQFGTGQEGNLALRELTGVSLDQAEQLQQVYNSTENAAEKLKKIEEITKASQPLEKQSLEAMKGLGGTAQRIATLTDRGIKIGEKAAPYIEKIEDWQYQALQFLMQLAEDVRAVKDYFMGDKKKPAEKSQNALKAFQEPLSLDPAIRHRQMVERRKLEQRANIALGEPEILSVAKDVLSGKDPAKGMGERAGYRRTMSALGVMSADQQKREFDVQAYRQIKGLKGKNTPEELQYIQTGEGAPADMLRVFEKAGKKSIIPQNQLEELKKYMIPQPEKRGESKGTESSSLEAQPVKVSFFVGTTDPRNQPTMTPQSAGRPRVMPNRGIG